MGLESLVNQNQSTLQRDRKGLSQVGMNSRLPALKAEFDWKEPYSQVLQSVSLNLSKAFINFFQGRAKFPNFKSKQEKQSIQYPQNVEVHPNVER